MGDSKRGCIRFGTEICFDRWPAPSAADRLRYSNCQGFLVGLGVGFRIQGGAASYSILYVAQQSPSVDNRHTLVDMVASKRGTPI